MPHVTPTPPPMQSSASSLDLAAGLRRDRQAFYVKVASGARSSMKMDFPKPALRAPLQPPGLFYLMACGLFNFDLECGEFHAFEVEVENWRNDMHFLTDCMRLMVDSTTQDIRYNLHFLPLQLYLSHLGLIKQHD